MSTSSDDTSLSWYQRGLHAADRGDYAHALALMGRAAAEQPERADVHIAMARILCALGRFEDALVSFAHGFSHGPGSARDHYDHGAVLTYLGQHEHAVHAYGRALAARADWPPALDNLGVSLQVLGRVDEAEVVFRRALGCVATPGEPWHANFTRRNLGSLLAQTGRLDEAVAVYREALAHPVPADNNTNDNTKNSDSADAAITFHELAKVLHIRGDIDDAEVAYREALAREPGRVRVYQHLGDLLLSAGRAQAAETAYREALALAQAQAPDHDHDHVEALRGLGAAAHVQGRFDDAREALEAAATRAPDHALVRFHLGVLYDHTDELERAVVEYRAALALAPDMYEARSNLAGALYRARSWDEARVAYQRVLELSADDVMARYLSAALADERQGEAPTMAPAAYVSQVFDDYATRYDEHMIGALQYQVPGLVRGALEAVCAQRPLVFGTLLDLGCGTGLSAEALGDVVGLAHGVDLSANMIDRARARGLYDELFQSDIAVFLARPELGLERYDLMVAADVFVYIGDLAPILRAARERLSTTGVFVFSVETLERTDVPDAVIGVMAPADGAVLDDRARRDDSYYVLHRTGRFAHGTAYVENTARALGFVVLYSEPVVLRSESQRPMAGRVFVLAPWRTA